MESPWMRQSREMPHGGQSIPERPVRGRDLGAGPEEGLFCRANPSDAAVYRLASRRPCRSATNPVGDRRNMSPRRRPSGQRSTHSAIRDPRAQSRRSGTPILRLLG